MECLWYMEFLIVGGLRLPNTVRREIVGTIVIFCEALLLCSTVRKIAGFHVKRAIQVVSVDVLATR